METTFDNWPNLNYEFADLDFTNSLDLEDLELDGFELEDLELDLEDFQLNLEDLEFDFEPP